MSDQTHTEQTYTEGVTADQLDAARRVIDRGMANGDIAETPDLHAFSRWAVRAAARIRAIGSSS